MDSCLCRLFLDKVSGLETIRFQDDTTRQAGAVQDQVLSSMGDSSSVKEQEFAFCIIVFTCARGKSMQEIETHLGERLGEDWQVAQLFYSEVSKEAVGHRCGMVTIRAPWWVSHSLDRVFSSFAGMPWDRELTVFPPSAGVFEFDLFQGPCPTRSSFCAEKEGSVPATVGQECSQLSPFISPTSMRKQALQKNASMRPPKLSERITLNKLFPNVDFNRISSHLALDDRPSHSSTDDYDNNIYCSNFVLHTFPAGYIHIGISQYFPYQSAFNNLSYDVNDNFDVPLALALPPETPPGQSDALTCRGGWGPRRRRRQCAPARSDICSQECCQPKAKSRAVEASILTLSCNTPKSDVYWIWARFSHGLSYLVVKFCAYYLNITQKIKNYNDAFIRWRSSDFGECTARGAPNKPLEVIHQPRRPAVQETAFMGTHAGEPRGGPTARGVDERRPLTIHAAIREQQEGMSHALDRMCRRY
ncbi:uncharacterized protein B0H64DRAFT_228184 [Chaetomium fimeti]|uniref:Uncharacterized protein n=1 Tax=Chaetomium fimeti TaxID=1854472 RepID=A0AAE0H9H2_9PEZI|nr:hypothetical protein B0H64DRAFT_228184 [Chaetomium fimeti]